MKALIGLAMVLACQFAFAFPDKPIRFVVPWPAGGGADSLSRLVNAEAQKILGQTVIIDNKAGASGTIATEYVARAAPDGYTLLLVINNHTTNHLLNKVNYDPVKDFTAITQIATSSYLLLVNPKFPAKTWQEFRDLVKSQPGKFSYASAGNGTLQHLGMEMLKREAGLDLVHVPYKGTAPVVSDLLAGHMSITFESVSGTLQQVRAGNLRAIAAAAPSRLAMLPDVPTFTEAGLPGFEVGAFIGIVAPASTPAEVLDRLNAAYTQALNTSAVREGLAKMGLQPRPSKRGEFGTFLEQQFPINARMLKDAGLLKDSGARAD